MHVIFPAVFCGLLTIWGGALVAHIVPRVYWLEWWFMPLYGTASAVLAFAWVPFSLWWERNRSEKP